MTPNVIERLHLLAETEKRSAAARREMAGVYTPRQSVYRRHVAIAEEHDERAAFFAAVEQALAAQDAEIVELQKELNDELDHNSRLTSKLDETKHNCGCEYDEHGDVCMVHHKPVREARERIAALEAEIAELRKRPTLDEVTQTFDDWAHDVHDERQSAEQVIVDLYAEKARAKGGT